MEWKQSRQVHVYNQTHNKLHFQYFTEFYRKRVHYDFQKQWYGSQRDVIGFDLQGQGNLPESNFEVPKGLQGELPPHKS